MKFKDLVSKLTESPTYQLNDQGREMVNKFHQLIQQIEESIIPVLEPFVLDPQRFKGEIAIQIVSSINSQEIGTEEFNIMSRLDTLTNGGKSEISGADFGFNQDDPILKYLEQTN